MNMSAPPGGDEKEDPSADDKAMNLSSAPKTSKTDKQLRLEAEQERFEQECTRFESADKYFGLIPIFANLPINTEGWSKSTLETAANFTAEAGVTLKIHVVDFYSDKMARVLEPWANGLGFNFSEQSCKLLDGQSRRQVEVSCGVVAGNAVVKALAREAGMPIEEVEFGGCTDPLTQNEMSNLTGDTAVNMAVKCTTKCRRLSFSLSPCGAKGPDGCRFAWTRFSRVNVCESVIRNHVTSKLALVKTTTSPQYNLEENELDLGVRNSMVATNLLPVFPKTRGSFANVFLGLSIDSFMKKLVEICEKKVESEYHFVVNDQRTSQQGFHWTYIHVELKTAVLG